MGLCRCGATLTHKIVDMPGREFTEVVKIKNVPVDYCENCDTDYLSGQVALNYAYSIDEAIKRGMHEFDYQSDSFSID